MVDDQNPTEWLIQPERSSSDAAPTRSPFRRHSTAIGLVAAGLVAGGVLASTLGASASTGSAPKTGAEFGGFHGGPASGEGFAGRPGDGDAHGRKHSDEKPLATSVTAILKAEALIAVPGGVVRHIDSDDNGATYEAHVSKADRSRVTVRFDKNLRVTSIAAYTHIGAPRIPH